MDAYVNCPTAETEHFKLRLLEEGDAEALFRVYNDREAVALMNDDNCDFGFYVESVERMSEVIRAWLNWYKMRSFIRFTVVAKESGEAVGTLEGFSGETGVYRVDIATAYERADCLAELFDFAAANFREYFGNEELVTKAIPAAAERRRALDACGWEFIGSFRSFPDFYRIKTADGGRDRGIKMKREDFERLYARHEPVPIMAAEPDALLPHRAAQDGLRRDALTVREAEHDIRQFFDILKYRYAGYELFAESSDFGGLEAALIKALPESLTPPELQTRIYKALYGHINDSHFTFLSGRLSFRHLYRAYFTDLTVREDGDGYKVLSSGGEPAAGHRFEAGEIEPYLFPTLPGPNGEKSYLIGVLSPEPMEELRVGGYSLRLHPCKTDSYEPHPEAVFTELRDDIPVVSHSSYVYDREDCQREDYEADGARYKDSESLIWSLLSNGGGSSAFPQRFIQGLNGSAVWELDMAALDRPERGGAGLYKRYDILRGAKIDLSKSDFGGRLYVLQNKQVASSGEAALMYARSVKNAVFVGSATMGCGQFGDTLTYTLKNSGLEFTLGCKVFYMEGFEEGQGLRPDYWLDSDDPVGELARYIKTTNHSGKV